MNSTQTLSASIMYRATEHSKAVDWETWLIIERVYEFSYSERIVTLNQHTGSV
jgi:hypothetical protein